VLLASGHQRLAISFCKTAARTVPAALLLLLDIDHAPPQRNYIYMRFHFDFVSQQSGHSRT
jgi:hypothetical protein